MSTPESAPREEGASHLPSTRVAWVLGAVLMVLSVLWPGCTKILERRTADAEARFIDYRAFERRFAIQSEASELRGLREDKLIRELTAWQQLQRWDLLQRFEWNVYDGRLARRKNSKPSQVALVAMGDRSITQIGEGYAIPGEAYNLLWPRMPVYGRALRELRRQGVLAVGFDVLLQEMFNESARRMADLQFARVLEEPGAPAALSLAVDAEPALPFAARAHTLGDVFSVKDADSVARRVRVYTDFRMENPKLALVAERWRFQGLEVSNDCRSLVLTTTNGSRVVQADSNGIVQIQVSRFGREILPLFVTNRVWHLGLVLAAYGLEADLPQSGIESGKLILRATNGAVLRQIPVDASGFLPLNWTIPIDAAMGQSTVGGTNRTALGMHSDSEESAADLDGQAQVERLNVSQLPELIMCRVEDLIHLDWMRTNRPTFGTNSVLTGKLVVVGSTASANNLRDRGPTPLASEDFLAGTHVNLAHQILADDPIIIPSFYWIAAVMMLLSATTCLVTWKLRGSWPVMVLVGLGVAWVAFAFLSFGAFRWMWPVVHPVVAGLLVPYGVMVTARTRYEQREQQRVRSVFAKMVSPDIVHEILGSGRIELGGERRELSVLFADVRGFTALTDRYQADAETYVAERKLASVEAEAYFGARAHEVLATVNLYLGALADVVKFHQGTLDKYIGDCVMAFWGAPVDNPRHAVHAVVAAIDAQRVIARLNAAREAENQRRLGLNPEREKAGKEPLLPLALLALGTGVNSGIVTVGLMGSDAHIMNYTVFGREVNLASRLEGVSGHSRIVIGEATYRGLLQHAPQLASLCRPLEPVSVKGFRAPVNVFEVSWQEAETVVAANLVLYQGTPSPAFLVEADGASKTG